MAKLNKKDHFAMYTIWISESAVAKANGDWETYDSHCWMAVRCAERLGVTAPEWVVDAAARYAPVTKAAA